LEERYQRQIRFAPVGREGHDRIRAASVLLVGCGALGSAIAEHLARAGVGRLRLCDRDFVEWANLQSQTLFSSRDAERNLPKAVAARERLGAINPDVTTDGRVVDVVPQNIDGLMDGIDLILDGTDNFETRFVLNDACVRDGKPWIYGGVVGSSGMAMTIRPGVTACYACLLGEPPPVGSAPTCETAGVLSTAVAWVASFQCTEAIKILCGRTKDLVEGLTTMDVWTGRVESFGLRRQDDCPVCVRRRFAHLEGARSGRSAILCGRNAVQVSPPGPATIDLKELERRLAPLGEVSRNEFLLRARLDGCEVTVFPDGRAIVKGTDDPSRARALVARYVGS